MGLQFQFYLREGKKKKNLTPTMKAFVFVVLAAAAQATDSLPGDYSDNYLIKREAGVLPKALWAYDEDSSGSTDPYQAANDEAGVLPKVLWAYDEDSSGSTDPYQADYWENLTKRRTDYWCNRV